MVKKQCYFTDRQGRRIQAYADAHEISFAEALRRILDQLLFTNAAHTENQTKNNLSYSRGGETDETQETKSSQETMSPEERDEVIKYVSVLQHKWGEDNNETTSNA
jgi:hypothetical protein